MSNHKIIMQNKGTILYIGGFELPDKNAAAQRVISNGKLLRSLGYNVVFYGISNEKGYSDSGKAFDFDFYNRKYPSNLREWINYVGSVKDYKRLLAQYLNLRAIICYNTPAISTFRLKRFCSKYNIKVITDCTEWSEFPKKKISLGTIRWVDHILRMYFVNKHVDGVIAISELLHKFYLERKVKTVKIPPLIDPIESKWTNSFYRENEIVQLVYAGVAFNLKESYVKDRLDLVVQALSNLKRNGYQFKFTIIGCNEEEFKIIYPTLVDDVQSLGDLLQFCGKLSHKKAIEVIKDADFSIFIRDENIATKAGFPTKFVESITCGIPVLTNSNSNVADYLKEGENGFFINTTSLKTIEEALIKAISIPPEDIKSMKVKTFNSHLFDYQRFTKEMQHLL